MAAATKPTILQCAFPRRVRRLQGRRARFNLHFLESVMKLKQRVFILGGANTSFIGKHHPDFIWKKHPDFGKKENPTLEELLSQVVLAACKNAGIEPGQIGKGYVGNFAGELFTSQGHLGSMVSRAHDDLVGKPMTRVEGACASGGLAVVGAIESIHAGHDIVLACGAEVQTTVSARDGADYLARASHYATERSLDEFTFPAMFARRSRFVKEQTATTELDIAHVVAKAYANANRNPLAHMKAVKISVDDALNVSENNPYFLKNEDYREHLKISDCSQVSDGGSALILASEAGVRSLGLDPKNLIEFVSYGQANGPLGKVRDYTRMEISAKAAAEAYASAELKPSDMGVAEVHDCFAVTEILMAEALGFAEHGKGGVLAREGVSQIGGKCPINTGGGLLAFGHPVGATGIKQVFEVYRQMRGECGDYQMPNRPQFGITANMGGDDRTAVVTILRNAQ